MLPKRYITITLLLVMALFMQIGLPRSQAAASHAPVAMPHSIGNAGQPFHTTTVGCFPGTGPAVMPTPSAYPPRVYLPLIIGPTETTTCDGVEQEPNDTHAQATPFEQSCYRGTTSWDGDLDWYQINLCTAVPALQVNLNGPATADLDLYLYGDPPGYPIAASEHSGSQESFTVSGLVTGTYFVLVSPLSGSGAYTLSGALTTP